MTKKVKRERVSKADWLEKALDVLESNGIDEVKIERLARELNISKSGFYWHFKDRKDLIRAMITYWEEEFTSVVTSNSEVLNTVPRERIYLTMKMILENNLTRLELPMRSSAETDPVAWEMISRVYQIRVDFFRSALSEMGFEGEDLEMRIHLLTCYHTWEGVMFRDISKDRRAKWLKLRLDLICAPPNKSNL
jgi:AcrR family transcriptional regulator